MNTSAKRSKSKTRFGVVGAGLWGSFHCKTLNALQSVKLPKRAR